MTDQPIPPETDQAVPTIARPRLSNWAWHPGYAMLWWSLIAVYWTGAVAALFFEPLADFYSSSLAGFLNVAFYPVFALFILSIGWMIAWKDALDCVAEHPDIENTLAREWKPSDFEGGRKHPLSPMNASSPIFIANAKHSAFRR